MILLRSVERRRAAPPAERHGDADRAGRRRGGVRNDQGQAFRPRDDPWGERDARDIPAARSRPRVLPTRASPSRAMIDPWPTVLLVDDDPVFRGARAADARRRRARGRRPRRRPSRRRWTPRRSVRPDAGARRRGPSRRRRGRAGRAALGAAVAPAGGPDLDRPDAATPDDVRAVRGRRLRPQGRAAERAAGEPARHD